MNISLTVITKPWKCSAPQKKRIIGRTPYDFSPSNQPDGSSSKDRSIESIDRAISGNPQRFEWVHCREDRTPFDAEISLNKIDIHGDIFIQAIVRDISERKHQERVISAANQLLKKTFASLDEAIFVINSSNRTITICNKSVERIFGYSEKEVVGRNTEFLHVNRSMYEEFAQRLFPALDTNGVFKCEFQMRRKDGEIFPSGHSVTQIINDLGERVAVVSLVRDITEKRRQQLELLNQNVELRERDDLLRQALDINPNIMFVINENETIFLANQSLADFYGTTVDKLTGVTQKELHIEKKMPPEEIDMWLADNRTALETGKLIYRVEYSHNHAREGAWYRTRKLPFTLREGTRAIFVLSENINEIKQNEGLLRKKEADLSRAQKVAHIGNWEWNIQTGDVYWSDEVFRIFRHEIQDISFDLVKTLIHPDDLEFWEGAVNEAVYDNKPFAIDCRAVRTDGSVCWIHNEAEVVRNEKGNPLSMFGTAQDITERKEAERKLQLSEKKYRILFETMLQGVIYHDADGNIIAANPATEKILGLGSDEIKSRATIDPRWQVVHEDGSEFPAKTRPSWVALKTGKPVKDVLMGVLNPVENQYRWIIVNAVPLFNPETKKISMVHTTFTDITDLKKSKKILQQYSGRLNVLHEIDKAILAAQSSEVIGQNALSKVRELIPCMRASIVVFDLDCKTARIIGVDVSGETVLEPGTTLSLDMFGNIEEFRRGKINFIHDINKILDPSPKIQRLKDEGIRSYINIPMISSKELVGSFNLSSDLLDFFSDNDLEIAREIADSLAVAIQNIRLANDILRHRNDLRRLSMDIINSQETERKRIAMELHDELGQALTAVNINLSAIAKGLTSSVSPAVHEKLKDTLSLSEQAIDHIHDISLFLRPSILDDLGLVPALRWFIDNFARRNNIEVDFKANGVDENLTESIKITLYRVSQEALNNIVKHAEATKVVVRLKQSKNGIIAIFKDNGKGFDVADVLADDGRKNGVGIIGMRERLALLMGNLDIESRIGCGTRMAIEIPFNGNEVS